MLLINADTKKMSLPTPPLKKPHEQKRKQRLEIKQKQTKQRKKKKERNKKNPINYKLLLI